LHEQRFGSPWRNGDRVGVLLEILGFRIDGVHIHQQNRVERHEQRHERKRRDKIDRVGIEHATESIVLPR